MSDPTFGIGLERIDNEPRPASKADMAVVGLVVTAPAANAALFPLNDPVLIYSDDATSALALGSEGTVAGQIDLINAQLGEFQVSARVVIVRVEEGADDEETLANLVGNASLKTGIHVLLKAGAKLGVVPRLVGVPGYTYQRDTGISAVTVANQGSGYTSAPTVAFTGGGGTGAAAVAVLGAGADEGKVVSVNITNPGSGYTSAPAVSFSGGAGAGAAATAEVADLANPVTAALPAVLNALLAHAPVTGPHSSVTAYNDWRETLNSTRLIPVETWVKVGSPAEEIDSVGAVLGIAVRRDHEKGGRPFHSWANQPVYGIVGPNRPLDFSLTDGATEAQTILAANGGVILRGEAGVETAIASGGFVFVGTDNAGEDELWRFYNVTRGRDYIHLLLLRTLRFYLGRFNLTGQTIQAVLNTVNGALRDLQAEGDILGFKVTFERAQNSPEELRQGRFKLLFMAEEAPVLRYLGVRSARYRPALDDLLDDLLAQMDVAA